MLTLLQQAGIFVWPLGLCSVLAVFIVVERLVALRPGRTIPPQVEEDFIQGRVPADSAHESVAGRILAYYHLRQPDAEQLKAYARLQIMGMERGLFILEIVISAAPLLGLLGTVTGLVQVFGSLSHEGGMPQPEQFASGIALALTTTILGLVIAIPAIVFNTFLNRRIDTLAARIGVGVERLIALRRAQA